MESSQQARFDHLHGKLTVTLKARGMSPKTVDSYSRAVRKLADRFDCCPDTLGVDELTLYFAELTDSYSWSTVKVERNGIMFFWKHVLHRHWNWIDIVKPPRVKRLPEVMSVDETRRERFGTGFLWLTSAGGGWDRRRRQEDWKADSKPAAGDPREGRCRRRIRGRSLLCRHYRQRRHCGRGPPALLGRRRGDQETMAGVLRGQSSRTELGRSEGGRVLASADAGYFMFYQGFAAAVHVVVQSDATDATPGHAVGGPV
ncbi:MAG: hypothetical protein GXP31_17935, partial [Kiritimatiellaeota bacterium]|nr:hypothetical protein [Kiritimatiellota bacterium]